jgi:hypothetical protein
VYSLLLALAAWAIEWFTSGPGSTMSYAPIIIAVVPVLLKIFTVASGATEPAAMARGEVEAPKSKTQKILFGG